MLERSFFQRDPVTCARELIGCELIWKGCAGIVVETEAYAARNDEASHTFVRPSAREFVARHVAGTAYVYFNYGVHWMLNVLVKGGSEDGFVLFRALEPTRGLAAMMRRRMASRKGTGKTLNVAAFCSGPGKLAQALGADGRDHGRDFCALPRIGFLAPARSVEVVADLRIGISRAAHLPWRFLLRDSPFVSVRAKGVAENPKPSKARRQRVVGQSETNPKGLNFG
jgi:DNA-3-methyladenine glycosylase